MPTTQDYSVVWFKRDLRVVDHAPLTQAAQRGTVLCLYIIEPAVWGAPDASYRHYAFVLECLRDLYKVLRTLGLTLRIMTGEATTVLQQIHQQAPFSHLFSHQETGNLLTFKRDQAVQAWCRHQTVHWHEFRQMGVIRALGSRNAWQGLWQDHMHAPCLPVPDTLKDASFLPPQTQVPDAKMLGLDDPDAPLRQRGGRGCALHTLNTFLDRRAQFYRGGISSPLSAQDACSRLSPYLAWGCLSIREVVQQTEQSIQAAAHPAQKRLKAGLNAFMSRLYWHCHFIQKLESEPAIEWRCMHPAYEGLRENEWNPQHFDALVSGRTGWPLVDACVVALRETGWINFRMRAMLVSVAAYPLWLHWRTVGLWLARQFVDYEPGIHWSQMQMQSGTTGINTTRVYNPVKQALDQDPNGVFVRQWLDYLRKVPDTWLFEPWRMPDNVCRHAGLDPAELPRPLVDLDQATRQAKARVHALRKQPETRNASKQVVERHASRKRSHTMTARTSRAAANRSAGTRTPQPPQLELEF